MTADIVKELEKIVDEVGKAEKFTLIFERSQILYSDQGIDITNRVIEALIAEKSPSDRASKTLAELALRVGGKVVGDGQSSSTRSRPSKKPARVQLLFWLIPVISPGCVLSGECGYRRARESLLNPIGAWQGISKLPIPILRSRRFFTCLVRR